MSAFFVTGTDTGVGKTFLTAQLTRDGRRRGLPAAALKPLATGDRADAEQLRQAMDGLLTLDEINPVWFRLPAAPLAAAEAEGRTIDFATLNAHVAAMRRRFPHLLVEGVGGWRVPLAPGYEVRDWARDLGLPVLVVARAGLGTINHTLLTVENIQAYGLSCAGIYLNPGPPEQAPDEALLRSNRRILEQILQRRVLLWNSRPCPGDGLPGWLELE